jgi:hypothetical protein
VITPGSFVAQSDDPAVLEALASFDGPGIVAVGGEGAARFAHDPRRVGAGEPPLHVEFAPTVGTVPIGGRSVWQQAQELAHLGSLAASPAVSVANHPQPAEPSPVDTLASWLLQQAALGQPAPGQVPK